MRCDLKTITLHAAPRAGKRQSGAALIVALVLLAAISIVGVANMQSSTLEMRMAATSFERERSFVIVDAGLREAEYKLSTQMNLKITDLQEDTCTGDKCFDIDCPNALCFDGEFDSGMTEIECEVSPDADSDERINFWEQPTVWSTAGKYREIKIQEKVVKYIYEFLCFVPAGSAPFNGDAPANYNSGEPLFRVTAYLEREGDRAPIMLQSTVVVEL